VRGTDFRYSLRVNPSSGNLHPTEAYLALHQTEGVPAGLYHYRAMEHALECRRSGSALDELAAMLDQPSLAQAEMLMVLSSIFWRESWKYRDRAYRYCLHDMGHAMASVLLAARGLGADAQVLSHFADLPLADFLGVTVQDEGPLLVIALNGPQATTATPRSSKGSSRAQPDVAWRAFVGPLQGTPNALSAEEVPYHLLVGMHQSTLLPDPPRPVPVLLPPAPESSEPEREVIPLASAPTSDPPLDRIARRRRSALDFDPAPRLSLGDLGTILCHATRSFSADFLATGRTAASCPALITLYLYVNRVTGLDPGVYRYRPDCHELILIKRGDVARRAAYLSLEQELGAHACVVFSMIADLERAAASFGNRGYRYAHIEAGFIGQGLYLGAEAVGWNATGIGAFYDDDVLQFLELSPEQGQVIYHFAIGRAVHDDRLITESHSSG
jgi:SagB-type dehydrogenase family enzyme